MNNLKAKLGFKGERGYSAYEIAVQNGYKGTEQDWLATLGTSSHLTQDTVSYTSIEGQTEFNLPANYTNDTFVDVYVDGIRLTSDDYFVSNNKVVLDEGLTEGKTVEIVEMTMSTNSLPIVTEVNSESTDDTVPSTKTVYGIKQKTDNNTTSISTLTTNLGTLENTITNLENSVSTNTSNINTLNTNLSEVSSKVENISEYSTEELVIGKWIDGKPIYRKVISGNLGSTSVPHGISNAVFKEPHGSYTSGNNTFPIPNVRPGYPDYNIGCYVTPTEVVFDKGNGLGQAHVFEIVLEYTKTTDIVESN